MKVIGVRHTGLVTSNMEHMIKYYTEVFGFEVIWDKYETPVGFLNEIRTVKMKAPDDSLLELCSEHIEDNHIAFTVEEVPKELKNALEDKLSWVRDPDGNLIEIVEE